MNALLPDWLSGCKDAITLLEEATSLPTPQLLDLTLAAERKMVRVRDGIIERLREEPQASMAEVWRAALSRLNAALSEVAAVEYPGSLNREHLSLTRKVLQELMAESEPRVRSEMEPLSPAAGIAGAIQGGVGEVAVHRVEAAADSLPESEPLP